MIPTSEQVDPCERLALSRVQLRALRDSVAPDSSRFPRSATMKVLTSAHFAWSGALLLTVLLARRPQAVALLLRFLPVGETVKVIAAQLVRRHAARAPR